MTAQQTSTTEGPKTRSTLWVVTLAAVTVLNVVILGFQAAILIGYHRGLSSATHDPYKSRGVALIVTRADSLSPLTGSIPAELAKEIDTLPGVTGICPGLVDFQTIDECGSDPVAIQGWPAGNYMFGELKIISGESLSEHNIGKKHVIIGSTLARLKSLKVGEAITVSDEKYNIIGVFESAEDIENGMVLMHLDDAQRVLGKRGMMTGCTVRVKDNSPEGIAAVRAQIEGPVAEHCGLRGKVRAKAPAEFTRPNNRLIAAQKVAFVNSLLVMGGGAIGLFAIVLVAILLAFLGRNREPSQS